MNKTDFIKRDGLASYLEFVIAKVAEKKSCLSFSDSFNSGTITECPRRLVYRTTGAENKISTELFFEEEARIYSRKKWQEFLSKCSEIKVIEKDFQVSDCNYNVTSIIDIIANINGRLYVTKIEPLDDSDYQRVQTKGAFKKHVIEVAVNMWLAEIDSGLLLYENKNNNKIVVFHIESYLPIINSTKEKCSMMLDCKINGKLPEKPYKERNTNECNACEFADKCWDK